MGKGRLGCLVLDATTADHPVVALTEQDLQVARLKKCCLYCGCCLRQHVEKPQSIIATAVCLLEKCHRETTGTHSGCGLLPSRLCCLGGRGNKTFLNMTFEHNFSPAACATGAKLAERHFGVHDCSGGLPPRRGSSPLLCAGNACAKAAQPLKALDPARRSKRKAEPVAETAAGARARGRPARAIESGTKVRNEDGHQLHGEADHCDPRSRHRLGCSCSVGHLSACFTPEASVCTRTMPVVSIPLLDSQPSHSHWRSVLKKLPRPIPLLDS